MSLPVLIGLAAFVTHYDSYILIDHIHSSPLADLSPVKRIDMEKIKPRMGMEGLCDRWHGG
jgi:hypothetical protein